MTAVSQPFRAINQYRPLLWVILSQRTWLENTLPVAFSEDVTQIKMRNVVAICIENDREDLGKSEELKI